MIGEVEDREFLGVTENNTSACLEEILREKLLDKGKTATVVNMDMSNLIRSVSKSVFPDADIVSDKFHVIKYANSIIDLCRIAVQKTVHERWQIKRLLLMKTQTFHKIKDNPKWAYKIKCFQKILKEYPEIKLLWDLKNKVHGFYKCKSLKTAKKSWEKLLVFLDMHTAIHPEFADLKKTFLNWETEILNYFIHRTTNAFIEGLNNRIETLKRRKFGFRSKIKFIKMLLYMLFPITDVIQNLLYTHF